MDINSRDANLAGESLAGACLYGANLAYANLDAATLSGADLTDAVLTGADLRGANLRGANLRGADLTGADLRGAILAGADMRGANLRGADLRDADLDAVKTDFLSILSAAPDDVEVLRAALVGGTIDGSVYEGECACLIGTIARSRGCRYTEIPGLTPISRRPAERWFLAIRQGDSPLTSVIAAITLEWIDEWASALPPQPI